MVYHIDKHQNIWYTVITARETKLNKTADVGKEKKMNQVSEYEIETFLKMILEILNGCKDIQEAQDKIKALLER